MISGPLGDNVLGGSQRADEVVRGNREVTSSLGPHLTIHFLCLLQVKNYGELQQAN